VGLNSNPEEENMTEVSAFLQDAESVLESIEDYDDVSRSLQILERLKEKLVRRKSELSVRTFTVNAEVSVFVKYEVEARSKKEAEEEFHQLFAYGSAFQPIDRDMDIMEEIVDQNSIHIEDT